MADNGSLIDWLSKLGIGKELNNIDILSGFTVNLTLSKVIPNYTVKLQAANTASTRINNWNTVINELEKVGVKVGHQQKSKILNGDDKVVYGILYQLKAVHDKHRQEVEVDVDKIDSRSDPKSSKSLLQLFILVIIKHYNFSVKEAVALLSNDSKYLAHILAKGFKDSPKPVQNMLQDFIKLLPQISTFCKNKQNQTFFLKSIKPALISKFLSITEISLQLLTHFIKELPQKLQIVKDQLIPTFVLCQRRHPSQIPAIVRSLIQIIGFNKNLVSFISSHSQPNEASLMVIQLLNEGMRLNELPEVFTMFKFAQFIEKSIQNLKNSEFFANSASFLLRAIEYNYSQLIQNTEHLAKIVQNLGSLSLSKRGDVIIFTNLTFGFLHTFGRKKNSIAPQFFKLAVQKYKISLNQDQSHNYLLNFINIMEVFPSIPSSGIVEAILFRYETSTCWIGELELEMMQKSMGQMDEKGALRVYNIITKVFVEQLGSVESICNILETIINKFDSKIIFDLNVKFVKICLAIFYANIRKLNYSKSLVQGTVKLDFSNAFYKAKNIEIQKLLSSIIRIREHNLNQAIEPLVCYTFIQSELKNKEQSQGIKQVMLLLGEEQELRKLYEADAKLLLQDARNQGKKKDNSKSKEEAKMRVSSDASLLNKKKDYLLHHPPKVPLDAQKGLEKYTKAFKEKLVKLSLEQEKRLQEEERLQELRRKFTLKILQKGIKIARDQEVNCIYEFNTKQKELQKDKAVDFSYLPFYDPAVQQERDVKAVQYFTKKYNKLFRVYYHNYGGKLRPNTIKLFDDISHTANLMQSANVWKLLRDHNLDLFITVKEVQHTVQRINAHLKKEYKDSSLLDFQVFENFLIQAALIMFSRPPKDMRTHPISDMLQQIVNKLKQHAHQVKIDDKIFDELDNYQSTKSEEIRQLNQKLTENPDYIVPEGYKKLTVKRLVFDYQFKLEPQSDVSDAHKEVYEIIDQILFQKLGFHLIEPYSSTVVEATARPILYQTSFQHSIKDRSLSSALPKASRLRQTARQGPGEEEIPQEGEETAQFGDTHNQTNLQKIENKFLKDKKQRQQERQKRLQEEEKRRQQRDRELKQLLEKHRQKQQQMQKDKEQKRRQELRRQQEEKKKKEKYEDDLKKKVEEYMKKKEAEKAKEEEDKRKKKQEEMRNQEKMKLDIQRKKKMVEEIKLKKKQQQQEKIERQKLQKQKAQQQARSKLQQKKQRTKQLLEEYKQRKQREQEEKKKLRQLQSPSQAKEKSKIKSPSIQQSKISTKPKNSKELPSNEVKIQQLDNN